MTRARQSHDNSLLVLSIDLRFGLLSFDVIDGAVMCQMMKPKMKHLRQPLRTVAVAKNLTTRYLDEIRYADHSERHFRGDVDQSGCLWL